MYCIKTYSTVSKYTHKRSVDNALNPLVCNHSECLAIPVYVSMCMLSVEIEAVVFLEYVQCKLLN